MYSKPVKIESFNDIYYYEYEEVLPKHPSYLVLGLPDAGLVGALAIRYLTLNTSMKIYGEVDSTRFPPVTVVHKSIPYSPFQLYRDDSGCLLALVSESPIPTHAVYPLAKSIVEYALSRGIDYLLSLSGIAVPNRIDIKKPKTYWIASTSDAAKEMEKYGYKSFDEGFIVGPYAIILKEAKRRGLNNIVVLVESFFDFPDPEAAAEALMALSKITGIEVDVSKLLEEAELIKLQARELMKQTKKALREMKKGYEMQMPLMYT